MNGKIMKKTITATIAVLLIVALAITLASFLNKPNMTADAAGDFLQATYASTHGQLPDVEGGHRTDAQAISYWASQGVDYSQIKKITTGEELYRFLNGEYSQTHAYLANDVSFSYNGNKTGYEYGVSKTSSNAVFTKTLDGNGYTLRLWGGVGVVDSNGSQYYQESDDYNTYGSMTYRYTGFLVAVNKGTIKNLVIDYESNHGKISAKDASIGKNLEPFFDGNDNQDDTGLFVGNNEKLGGVGGVIAGLNGDGGVIDNVRLNLNSNFKIITRQGTDGDLQGNFVYSGGYVGRAGRGSSIENSQIVIGDNVGVYGGAQGIKKNYDIFTLAVAGGIVGKIDQSKKDGDITKAAVVKYCAVSGSGEIKAYVASGSGVGNTKGAQRDGLRAYAGGAIGASLNITTRTAGINEKRYIVDETDYVNNHLVAGDQIMGIISEWTGSTFANYRGIQTTSYGQLFGSVGNNVERTVVLYDVVGYRKSHMMGERYNDEVLIDDGQWTSNVALDYARASYNKSWVGIYPTTEGGQVIARFNGDNISVHAIAEGSAVSDADLLAVSDDIKTYSFVEGQTGNVIWNSSKITKETDESGNEVDKVTARINLMNAEPVYAEKNTITTRDVGLYTYSFGQITTLSFENTNGENGNQSSFTRTYKGKNAVLNKPNVVAALNTTLEAYKDEEWIVKRNGELTSSDMSGTALPGTYRMTVNAEEETYFQMGYYSDAQRIAAWVPSDYTFTITKGELFYGSQTRVEVGWSQSAYFHLYVSDRADDFDTVKVYRNGLVQDIAFTKEEGSPNAYVTVTDSTGKNGMKYGFIAYAKDGDKDIIVAETKSSEDKLVKIDNELPEISDISYFVRDEDGNDTPIAPNDRFVWRRDRIVARYNVVDTKSGLNFAPTLPEGKTQGISIDNGDMKEDGSYDVEVVLSRNTEYVINYTDAMGNVLPVKLQAYVDYMTTQPALEHSRITYPTADYGYSTKGARIRFNPTVGCSEWRLQYSWEKNPDGSDKWEFAMAQDANGANTDQPYIINGNKEQSFLINWNMGDPVRKVGAPFKMRIVNMATDADGNALYDPVEYSRDGVITNDGYVGSFCINYKIASIYIDNSLKAVKVSGGLYDGRTLEDLLKNLSADELKEFLDKEYDGTSVFNNSIYAESFYVDVEFMSEDRENPQDYVDATGIGVLYSLAYVDVNSAVTEIQTRINVNIRYQSANAGTVNIIVEFADAQEDESVLEDYDWYFAQFLDSEGEKNIDFTNEDEMVADKFISSQRLIRNREIRKREFEIDLSDVRVVRGLQNSYYYGELVPQIVKAYILAGEPFDIKLTCDAQNRVDVGLYECTGEAINYDSNNLKLTVKKTIIDIEAKPVYVETMFDGSRDIPSTVNAGTTHEFTASYKDVDGKTQKATVTSSMGDDKVVDGKIYKKGNYEIIVSLTDKNYAISDANRDDGSLLLNFKIVQGRLALAMGTNVVEYNGGKGIKYNAGVPANINSNLFTDNLEYTYYTYNASARYDATSKQITGGTWDRTSGTSKEPSAVGLYHVEVYYKGNDAFFAETYSGDLNITKASTEIKFGKQVSYPYKVDGNDIAIARTFDVIAAEMTVSEKNGDQLLWHYSDANRDNSLITIYYRNQDGEYVEISDNALGGGWYQMTGNYAFRVKYAGDESHEECIINATLRITPALFEGLIFQGASGTYDGSDFATKLNVVVPYPEAEVTFTYANKNYTSLKDIHITEAGSYRIRITVKQNGYETESDTVDVVIAKARVEANKLTAVPVSAVYDGQRHAVTFNGFDIVGGKYYYKGFEAKISSSDSEGNLWAVNAGIYNGQVTVRIDNFENYIIDTYIQIDRAVITVDSARTDLEEKLPSGMSVNGIYGAYTINGEETSCYLIYRNAETGDIVNPNSKGELADGKYTVELNAGDNYVLRYADTGKDVKWDLIVGRINEATLTVPGIIAVVIVVLVMVAAIITSVVVVNKRKKNEGIA